MQSALLNSIGTDEHIREQALDPTRSFIVQAPAGSGKTGLLTQRFLVLLSIAEVAPEECLAITFTRKAAAEMRDRILFALERAKNPIPPSDLYEQKTWRLACRVLARDRLLGWDLLHNPNRLKIQTIDAFCASLTRQMPILSRFGAMPAIKEDASELYQTAAQNLLKDLETDAPWSKSCRVLLSHLDNNLSLAVRLLANMLSHRDQWLPHIGKTYAISELEMRQLLESGLESVIRESLSAVVSHAPIEPAITEILTVAPMAAVECERLGNGSIIAHCRTLQGRWPGNGLGDLPSWYGLAELLFTEKNTLRKIVTKQQGFPAPSNTKDSADKQYFKLLKERMEGCLKAIEHHPVFLEKLRLLRECPPKAYTEEQWEMVWALTQLLPILAAQLTVVFQENNAVDFTEMSLAALKALGDSDAPTDLALGLDYRIRHILVDEFQDTALSQFRLLEQLTAGWQPMDGRTLFLVGDPMQSIYRFRQAEVGLFIRAKQHGIGDIILNALKLTTNFRSEPELVEWVNTFFTEQFPKEDDIVSSAIAFTASIAFRNAHETRNAHKITSSFFARKLSVTPESEAKVIVELINDVKIIDPQGSIALLVRSRHHLKHLLPQLRDAKISYEGIQLERLTERPIVQDLLALTRALLHLGDRIAWLAILRMPSVQLSLEDLFLIANYEPALPIWHTLQLYSDIPGLSDIAKNRLLMFVSCLSRALLHYQRLPLRTWICQTWVALGGCAESLYPAEERENNVRDSEAYFSLLEQMEADGDFDEVGALEEKLQSHYVTTPQNNTQDNIVQIMTIHKAKGLEFDTVIVPGMGRRTKSDSERLLLWEERIGLVRDSYFLMAPIKRVGDAVDPIYSYLKRQEGQRAGYESNRLGYVAATRARKRLYWLEREQLPSLENS
ncbi:MAG TPA: UvrD-helicase domain-containing protein [Gammaproteobacteria bacterium]|nr:UvrD-helicase domain-containing protein [Gammaproteobacteria bacterium]HRA42923.1 UvrD-helicase domain-containing protein [Gammaproteobacteria bacterium]